MKKFRRAVTLLLIANLFLCGCSMLTAQGRQERAYRRYVEKQSRGRLKQQRKLGFQRAKIPHFEPSAPVETTHASGPESVTTTAEAGGEGGY